MLLSTLRCQAAHLGTVKMMGFGTRENAEFCQIGTLRRALLTIAVPAWGIIGFRRNMTEARAPKVTEEQLRELFSSDFAAVPQLAARRRYRSRLR